MLSDGLGPFIVRSVAGTGAVQIAAMFATFVVGVQLARQLGVAGYGYYGLAFAIITTAGIPGEMGLPKLVMREVAIADARSDAPYLFGVLRWGRRIAAYLSVAIAVAILIGAFVLGLVRPSPLVLTLVAGAPVIPFIVLAKVDGGALRALNRIVASQVPAFLLRPVAASVMLLLIYLAGLKLLPWVAMGLNAITAVAAWALTVALLNRRLPPPTAAREIREGRRWLSSTVPMALSDGMLLLQTQLSVLLLGLLATAADVGLFRIAVSTAIVLSAPGTIVAFVALPLISRLHADNDKRRLQKLLTHAARAQVTGVLLLSLPLFLRPGTILTLVYGHEFAPAANVLRIVLIGQVASAGFGLNAALLNMTHRERRVTRAMAVGLFCNAIAIAALLPIFGITGAAIGYASSMLAWNLLAWIDARRFVGVDTSVLPSSAK